MVPYSPDYTLTTPLFWRIYHWLQFLRKKTRGSKISGKYVQDLSKEIFWFYLDNGYRILNSFSNAWDTKLIFPSSLVQKVPPSMIAKKALLYSGHSICILPCILRGTHRKAKISDLDYFINFFDTLKPLILSNKILPFPLFHIDPHKMGEDWEMIKLSKMVEDERIESWGTKAHALTLFATREDLIHQIAEDIPNKVFRTGGGSRLFLPHLKGLDIETMQKVLQDHGDPTARFRSKFRELLASREALENSDKFLHAMDVVDLEVRQLNEDFKHIVKDRVLRKTEVGLGVISLGLNILFPAVTTSPALSIFGSITLIDGTRKLITSSEAEKELDKSDFLLPWLLSKRKER